MTDPIRAVCALSPADKLQLVQDLWDDLAATPDAVPTHQWQLDEVARRKARFQSSPGSGLAWEEVKGQIRQRWGRMLCALVAALVGMSLAARGQDDDVAQVASQDLRAGGTDEQRYFLIGPKAGAKEPADGYALVVVLPSGDGSADFHPFVKRLFQHAVADDFLVAQPVAVRWTPNQAIVWPTRKDRIAGKQFSTEEFVETVIEDVGRRHKLDSRRVFTLSWSSGGPAAYALSLSSQKVAGSLIAMSVYKPRSLPPLKAAAGHAYYLYHSPDDRVCPFRTAQQAASELEKNGAQVKLVTYDGGHGWRGPVYDDVRAGLAWLDEHWDQARPDAAGK